MGDGAVGGYNSSLTHFLLWALLWHPAGNDTADLHAYVTKILAVSSLGCGDIARDANMSWPRIESCFWIFLSGLQHHAGRSGAWGRGGGPILSHTAEICCLMLSLPTLTHEVLFSGTWWHSDYSHTHAYILKKIQATRGESDPFGKLVLKCAPWHHVTCPEGLWC